MIAGVALWRNGKGGRAPTASWFRWEMASVDLHMLIPGIIAERVCSAARFLCRLGRPVMWRSISYSILDMHILEGVHSCHHFFRLAIDTELALTNPS